MSKPIRIATLSAGTLLLVLSLISLTTFWPRITALDWPFFRVFLIVSLPLIYFLIATFSGQTACYWIALALLKAETFQWLLMECSGQFVATYKALYPIRERQVRIAIGGEERKESR
jgi:hypothetical protein